VILDGRARGLGRETLRRATAGIPNELPAHKAEPAMRKIGQYRRAQPANRQAMPSLDGVTAKSGAPSVSP
jgi:hypothetical protein